MTDIKTQTMKLKEPLVFSEVVLKSRILKAVDNLLTNHYIQRQQFDDVLRIIDAEVLK